MLKEYIPTVHRYPFVLPPSFAETKYSDERFDYLKPFIMVAFPPLTLDHPIKTAGKETNKHISFIMKCDNRMFYEQTKCFSSERKPCNFNTAYEDIPQASGKGTEYYTTARGTVDAIRGEGSSRVKQGIIWKIWISAPQLIPQTNWRRSSVL